MWVINPNFPLLLLAASWLQLEYLCRWEACVLWPFSHRANPDRERDWSSAVLLPALHLPHSHGGKDGWWVFLTCPEPWRLVFIIRVTDNWTSKSYKRACLINFCHFYSEQWLFRNTPHKSGIQECQIQIQHLVSEMDIGSAFNSFHCIYHCVNETSPWIETVMSWITVQESQSCPLNYH